MNNLGRQRKESHESSGTEEAFIMREQVEPFLTPSRPKEEKKLNFRDVWECKEPRLEIINVLFLEQSCSQRGPFPVGRQAGNNEQGNILGQSKHIFVV